MTDELLGELKVKFGEMKKELGFKASFKDLNDIFFLEDFVLKEGYVSPQLSRMVCFRIVNTFQSWNSYMHSLLIPNPGSLINVSESQVFSDDEKQKIRTLISKALGLVSTNTLAGINKDKKKEAEFIDGSVEFWKKEFKPGLRWVMEKINGYWLSK